MGNPLLLWLIAVLPWATLLLMPKEDIRRFMSVALFAALTSLLIIDASTGLQWMQAAPFEAGLRRVMSILGLVPVYVLWLMKYTYGHFWRFVAVDLVFNVIYTFAGVAYVFPRLQIISFRTWGPALLLCVLTVHGLALYLYQVWQQGATFADKSE